MKTAKRKGQSQILEAVHETALGFHRLGFIDKRKMQEYDALCLEPISDFDVGLSKSQRVDLLIKNRILTLENAYEAIPCTSN